MLIPDNTKQQKSDDDDIVLIEKTQFIHYIDEDVCADLNKNMGQLIPNHNYYFVTGKRWNLHDILIYAIKQLSPCNLYITTYAIKEYQSRLIVGLKEDGIINELHCLLDYRVPTLDPDADQLLTQNATKIGYMRTHAKLTVIESEKASATIIGSANLTRNTNYDVGVLCCNTEVSNHYINWIKKHINGA